MKLHVIVPAAVLLSIAGAAAAYAAPEDSGTTTTAAVAETAPVAATAEVAATAPVAGVATTAEQHILFDAASSALLYDADGAGGAAAIRFGTVQAGATVTAADIWVV